VLAKRAGVSWNEATRRTIDARLALPEEPRFFCAQEWATLKALCARILPQPADRPPVPIAAFLDHRLANGRTDGYRRVEMPELGEAWRRGLAALDAEAQSRHGRRFHELAAGEQDALLARVQSGDCDGPAWEGLPAKTFFVHRVLLDLGSAYYAYPAAWNELGFGGPASPRGYVRMDFDRRDPWEAAEARPGEEAHAMRLNHRVR